MLILSLKELHDVSVVDDFKLGYCYREEVTAKLKDTSDGTFLVRNSQGGKGYTLTVRYVC